MRYSAFHCTSRVYKNGTRKEGEIKIDRINETPPAKRRRFDTDY